MKAPIEFADELINQATEPYTCRRVAGDDRDCPRHGRRRP